MRERKRERDQLIVRIARLGGAKWTQLQAVWRLWPPDSPTIAAVPSRPTEAATVLCWWCREYHSSDEVEACMALPRKVDVAKGNVSLSSVAKVGQLLAQYVETLAFLSATSFPDGQRRQTGTLSLRFDSGLWRLSATDAETSSYATLEGSTPDDVLLLFEAGLADGSITWRPSKYPSMKNRR